MRVLIDCTQISRLKAGVGVYAINLVRELIGLNADMRLWLLVQDDDPEFLFDDDCVTVVRVPARSFRRLPFRFLLEQAYIPWLCYKYRIDVVHSLHYAFPLIPLRARKVVTVHDMTSFKFPEVHTRFRGLYYRFFLRASRRGADHLLFVSRSTHNDYQRKFHRNDESCHVAMLGTGPEFHAHLDPQRVDTTLQKYEVKKPYILYVGTLEPRKNLTRLVEAFAGLVRGYPDHTLIIAGKKGWMYDKLFETVHATHMDERVKFLGFIPEEDKPYLIRGAQIFAYPSLYEGFGIPVLEALSCGTPVLTSNVSSLPEVAGDAALLCDPMSTEALSSGLARLLASPELRKTLSFIGLAQAKKFNWKTTAEETYAAYCKAMSQC
jgi:glycosyltransferase involved in cell wall biosynthesis